MSGDSGRGGWKYCHVGSFNDYVDGEGGSCLALAGGTVTAVDCHGSLFEAVADVPTAAASFHGKNRDIFGVVSR